MTPQASDSVLPTSCDEWVASASLKVVGDDIVAEIQLGAQRNIGIAGLCFHAADWSLVVGSQGSSFDSSLRLAGFGRDVVAESVAAVECGRPWAVPHELDGIKANHHQNDVLSPAWLGHRCRYHLT